MLVALLLLLLSSSVLSVSCALDELRRPSQVRASYKYMTFLSRSFSGSQRKQEESWFKSLFVRKVDPRKDAHSHLLSKKEESNLYKIQCEWHWPHSLHWTRKPVGNLCCFCFSSQREARISGRLQQTLVRTPTERPSRCYWWLITLLIDVFGFLIKNGCRPPRLRSFEISVVQPKCLHFYFWEMIDRSQAVASAELHYSSCWPWPVELNVPPRSHCEALCGPKMSPVPE